MSETEYCFDNKAWTKWCPGCAVDFIGTDNHEESLNKFTGIFGLARRAPDGLQQYCKECAKKNRRRRNGVNDGYDESEMYKKQGGACALCTIGLHLPYRYSADPQGARVDHDHKTGKARGLLCHRCNTMIGLYEAIMEVFPEFDLVIIDKYIEKGQ